MKGLSSKLRARAASPSAATTNAAPAAAGTVDHKHRWGVRTAQEHHESLRHVDAFFGFPFGAGVSLGEIAGFPVQLLGFILYAFTVLPRNILYVLKVIFFHLTRALLQAVLAAAAFMLICYFIAVSFQFNPDFATLGSRLPQFTLPEGYSMRTLALPAFFVSAALFFIPKFRALFNTLLLLLLVAWAQREWFEQSVAWCSAIAYAVSLLAQTAVSFAAANSLAIVTSLIALLVALYLLDFLGRLLHLCLWLLLFCPRFAAGFMFGVSSSLEYMLCALTLNYHPRHLW